MSENELKPNDVLHNVPEGGWKPMSMEVVKRRVAKLRALVKEYMKLPVDELAKMVKLCKGNVKTGGRYYTVSLAPVIDCVNCALCKMWCYDLQSVVITKNVQNLRAINSALHTKDPGRYWVQIESLVQALFVDNLRINVGGDISGNDLNGIISMCKYCPKTIFHVFTKSYKDCNRILSAYDGELPANLKLIYSRWPGMKCDNPYRIPECHVDFGDGKCEAPADSPICEGNCTKCAFEHTGCHGLNRGESVVIKYHTNVAFAVQGTKKGGKK